MNGEDSYFKTPLVPAQFWKLQFGFAAPIAELPATSSRPAEQLELTTYHPIPFLPVAVYNPYETRIESSVEFAAMLLSRLTNIGLGIELSESEILSNYLEENGQGCVAEKSNFGIPGAQRFSERFGDIKLLQQPGRTWSPILLFLLVWSFVGLVSFRKRQYPMRAKALLWGLSILLCAGTFSLSLGHDQGNEFLVALFHWFGRLQPENFMLGALGFLTLASLPAYYLMSCFSKMDVPPPVNMKLVKSRP